ncbi:MAG: hypothetical protein RJA36_3351, partial [Pseudomonadota bacterium]
MIGALRTRGRSRFFPQISPSSARRPTAVRILTIPWAQ